MKVDVRIVSATNKDLAVAVEGEPLPRGPVLPPAHRAPCTSRRCASAATTSPSSCEHFVEKLAPRTNPQVVGLDDEALGRLMAYAWPGNVRELENVIEQALVFAEGDRITVAALPAFLKDTDSADTLAVPRGEISLPEVLEDLERQLILKAFRKAKGVKTETARLLGVKTSALYYKLEKYGIS